MTNAHYKKLTIGLISAWFLGAVATSALHWFENLSGGPPVPLLAAAVIPLAVFSLWFAASPEFRRFAARLSPRTLTMAQTWRINGYIFLILYGLGLLPGIFALPAGLGDMAIGATAPWIARKGADAAHRRRFLVWQALGIADLVMAVTLGATAGLIRPQGVTTAVMTVLPMSLVPTFFVPVLLVLHLISIAEALQWPQRKTAVEMVPAEVTPKQ